MGVIFTIGHSTRSIDEFLGLLAGVDAKLVVDVRRYPGSKRYPHFGRDPLRASLGECGIDYQHAPELGGRPEPDAESPNTYWRNDSFRAYADHMRSAEFQSLLGALLERSASGRQVIMCAEAVPWRCHRNLISDALVARAADVRHILSDADPAPHQLNPAARLGTDGVLTYAAEQPAQPSLFPEVGNT